jgi:hypothetical protein
LPPARTRSGFARDVASRFALGLLLFVFAFAFEFFQRLLFGVAVHRVALHQDGEIHAVSIEFGPIHTGEFAFALDQNAAAAAHPGAIDHDWIQADHGANLLFARHVGDGPHHRDRAHCQHLIDARSVVDQLAQFVGHQPFVAVTAIVGGDEDGVADLAHLVFEKDEVFVSSTEDRDHAIASLLHGRSRRIRHCRAHASAHHHDRAEVLDLRGLAQRADNVEDAVSGFERVQKSRGLADRLHDNVDRALLGVRAFDGEWDALAFFVDSNDDELARPLLARDAGRLDHEALDSRGDKLSVDDFEHGELRWKSECIVTWACDMGM